MADYMNKHGEIFERYANDMGAELLRIIKKNTPVGKSRTITIKYKNKPDKTITIPHTGGTLRRNASMQKAQTSFNGSVSVSVYNNTEYAPHVEYGHRIIRDGKCLGYVPGKHFWRNSIYQFQPTFWTLRKAMQKELEELLSD